MKFVLCLFVSFLSINSIYAHSNLVEMELNLRIKENLIKVSQLEEKDFQYWYIAGMNEGFSIALRMLEVERDL